MARLIKCPRCQSQIDVTNMAGGGTVRCPDCGAMVRIPTGTTGQYQNVKAQVPQTAAAPAPQRETKSRPAGGGKSTSLFKKMSGARQPGGAKPPSRASVDAEARRGGTGIRRKGSNTGLIAGASVGGAILLIVVLFLAMDSKKNEKVRVDEERTAKNAAIRAQNKKNAEEAARRNAELDAQEAAEAAAKAGGKDTPKLQKKGGKYEAPTTFEPGAPKWIKGEPEVPGTTPAGGKEYDALASAGKVNDIVNDEKKWTPYVIHGMLSENEPMARTSFQAMRAICDKLKISTETGSHPVNIELFNSAQWRGGQFMQWLEWLQKNLGKVTDTGTAVGPDGLKFAAEDPNKANWDDLMKDLRAGGALDKIDRPEGRAYARVQGMGKGAYPKLIAYLDHEELPLARAALTVLTALTGRSGNPINATNKSQVKSEWEAWYNKDGK